MENTLFPISMEMHIGFALLALLVFGMQFIRLRKKYYLVLAAAVPCSLLAYVVDNTTFFYALGIAEGAALVLAFILARTVDRDKAEQKAAQENTQETEAAQESEAMQETEAAQESAAVQEDAE